MQTHPASPLTSKRFEAFGLIRGEKFVYHVRESSHDRILFSIDLKKFFITIHDKNPGVVISILSDEVSKNCFCSSEVNDSIVGEVSHLYFRSFSYIPKRPLFLFEVLVYLWVYQYQVLYAWVNCSNSGFQKKLWIYIMRSNNSLKFKSIVFKKFHQKQTRYYREFRHIVGVKK